MSTPVSPKLASGATWALVASLASMISPDMLAPLGKYQGLAYMVISAIAFAGGVYAKEDPLRTAGAASSARAAATAPADPSTVVDELARRLNS